MCGKERERERKSVCVCERERERERERVGACVRKRRLPSSSKQGVGEREGVCLRE